MAEGFSHKQSEEDHDILPPLADVRRSSKPDLSDRFKVFIGDLFRPKHDQQEQDEDDEKDKKGGRFLRLFGRLFRGSIAQKEEVGRTPTAEAPQKGMFFEMTPAAHTEAHEPTAAERPARTQTPEVGDAPVVTTHTEVTEQVEVPEEATHEQPQVAPTEQVSELAQHEEVVRLRPDTQERQSESSAVAQSNTAESGRTKTVYTNRRPYYAPSPDRPVFDLPPRQEKQPSKRVVLEKPVPAASEAPSVKHPEVNVPAPERTVRVEKIIQKNNVVVEKVAAHTPEKVEQRAAVHTIEKRSERLQSPVVLKEVEKVEIEKEDEANEIAYELSHEHKDADKQAAAAWAAVQASASTTAAQNAAAIAAALAEGAKSPAIPTSSQKKQQSLYAQASMTGFVTAVVIAAIVFFILLVT